jgi:hypothetical protein
MESIMDLTNQLNCTLELQTEKGFSYKLEFSRLK